MAQDKPHHGYDGLRPGVIDHRSLPTATTPAPEVKKPADHFARVRPEAIDHRAKTTPAQTGDQE